MKDINIKIKEIRVINFSTRDSTVELEIYFDKYKTLKNLEIDDPNEIAHDLIVEIRRKVKEVNKKHISEEVLDNIVNVRVEQEEEIMKKISMFLAKLSDKVNEVKNLTSSDNYLNSISLVKSMKLEL